MEYNQISRIKQAIEPIRSQLINHQLYSNIIDIEDLRIFMKYHVFAVWDFMSLLKSLQKNLTCTTVPWYPKSTGNIRYLVNEIVTGEESDLDLNGDRKSHFEMYLDAMEDCVADTSSINIFNSSLKSLVTVDYAFKVSNIPEFVQDFVNNTFEIINTKNIHIQAGVFTFGREDLIPDMFIAIINDMFLDENTSIEKFKYYLERHIEIDGGHHKELAWQMTSDLCGQNEESWNELELEIINSLNKRVLLWDGILEVILDKRQSRSH